MIHMLMGHTTDSAKRLWQNLDYKQKVVEGTALGKSTVESIEKRSQATKDLWLDSDYRRKMENRPPPPNKVLEQDRIQKTCPKCNGSFSVLPCRSKQKYCSRQCRKTSKQPRGKLQEKLCEACNNVYTPTNGLQRCCKVCAPTHGATTRWRKFGLTQVMYDEMLNRQQHACAICSTLLSDIPSQQIHLDHDHSSGKARGVLCQRCNILVGVIEVNKKLLSDVERYLSVQR